MFVPPYFFVATECNCVLKWKKYSHTNSVCVCVFVCVPACVLQIGVLALQQTGRAAQEEEIISMVESNFNMWSSSHSIRWSLTDFDQFPF